MHYSRKSFQNNQGLTLLELLFTIVIGFFMTGLTIANVIQLRQRGNDSAAIYQGRAANLATEAFLTDNPGFQTPTGVVVKANGQVEITGDTSKNYLVGFKHMRGVVIEMLYSSFFGNFIVTSFHCNGTAGSTTFTRQGHIFATGSRMVTQESNMSGNCNITGAY